MPNAIIKCPFPFPNIEATTKIELYQEVDTKYEGPQETLIYEGMAVFDQTSKTIMGTDNKLITLSGTIIIKGQVQTIETEKSFQGFVKIGTTKLMVRKLAFLSMLGMVYSTELELL